MKGRLIILTILFFLWFHLSARILLRVLQSHVTNKISAKPKTSSRPTTFTKQDTNMYMHCFYLSLNLTASRKLGKMDPLTAEFPWALWQGRFSPLLGFEATQGLLGVGMVGEGSYIHAFKMLLNKQGNRYKDVHCSFVHRSQHF